MEKTKDYEQGLAIALQNGVSEEEFEEIFEALSYENNGYTMDKTEKELVDETLDTFNISK